MSLRILLLWWCTTGFFQCKIFVMIENTTLHCSSCEWPYNRVSWHHFFLGGGGVLHEMTNCCWSCWCSNDSSNQFKFNFFFYCVTKTRSKPHFKIQSHSLPLLLNNNWSFVFYNFFTSNYLLPEVVCVRMGGSSLTPCVVQQLCRRGGINETFRGRHSRHPGIYRDSTGLGTMCEQALILPIWKKAIRR